jgi:hypothetical protein
MRSTPRRAWQIVGGGVGAAALFGLGHVATSWLRYGRVHKPRTAPTLLDRFLPTYEVLERHQTVVAAPVETTYAAARAMDLMDSAAVRAIFRGRELLMRATPTEHREPQPLIDEVLALGWGVLAQVPGREIVVGAVTQPWEAQVRFRSLPPDEFAAFDAPGFAKIAWTIRAEPLGPATSRFYTETRVATTDADARRRFRRYWAMVSPGVRLIRRESLRLVRSDAERQCRAELPRGHDGLITQASSRAQTVTPAR